MIMIMNMICKTICRATSFVYNLTICFLKPCTSHLEWQPVVRSAHFTASHSVEINTRSMCVCVCVLSIKTPTQSEPKHRKCNRNSPVTDHRGMYNSQVIIFQPEASLQYRITSFLPGSGAYTKSHRILACHEISQAVSCESVQIYDFSFTVTLEQVSGGMELAAACWNGDGIGQDWSHEERRGKWWCMKGPGWQ